MAKHFIKKDNHIEEMNEKEYQSYQGRKSLWYLLLIIVFASIIKTCVIGNDESSTNQNDSIVNIK